MADHVHKSHRRSARRPSFGKIEYPEFCGGICGACRAWPHCAGAAEVVIRVQLGKTHVGALRANIVLRSIGVDNARSDCLLVRFSKMCRMRVRADATALAW